MMITPNSPHNCSPLPRVRAFLAARGAPRVAALCLAVAAGAPGAKAILPTGITTTVMYKKGYLDVTKYQWANREVFNNGTSAGSTTAGLNEAIGDARLNGLVLYFPAGTYLINDTLKAYMATDEDPQTNPNPTNGIVMVGSTLGARPVIKLAAGVESFTDAANPKVMVEFKNFSNPNFLTEHPSQGYNSMIRGIDINCNGTVANQNTLKKNLGAIGLYMNLAQECSIENVKVTATNAWTGIRGLPGRGWGAVNIEVEGGTYGIDTLDTDNLGSTVAGLILKNQTGSAIRHTGMPLTIVGFEIVTPSTGPGLAAITLTTAANDNKACKGVLGLIDGSITLGTTPTVAAIDNTTPANNVYVRNVFVYRSGAATVKLVKSANLTALSATGPRTLIKEYSFTKQTSIDFDSYAFINGGPDQTPWPANNGEYYFTQANVTAPPADLRSRHVWASLPSVDDADAYDPAVTDPTFVPSNGVVTLTAKALQDVIDAHSKVFLRKGTYKIGGPITLNGNTRLFGVARTLTTLQPDDGWAPTGPVTFITTSNWVAATTYLGDLQVSVPRIGGSDGTGDYFSALQWRAGADSLLHVASIGLSGTGSGSATRGKSLVTISNNGGGRWYFFGRRSGVGMEHPDFRILEVSNTLGNPLWIYGLNLEHARCDAFAQFLNSDNIRIFGVKTEFAGEGSPASDYMTTTFLSYQHVNNVVMVGHSALRYACDPPFNAHEFLPNASNVDSNNVVAALIAPQANNDPQPTGTLLEKFGGVSEKVNYPATVSLFKRGTPDDSVMVHNDISY